MSTTDHKAAPTTTWLTQEAFDRLTAELAQLIENRPAISAEINARREEGDLRENGGYHAAKEEQGKQESRIRQLQDLLRSSEVGEAPADDGVVEPGMVVTIRYDDGDTEQFLLGSREIGATTDLAVYSPDSALGAAIVGHASGESVTYTAPSGKDITVEIASATPFGG
ncbi:transcription elongation factor GreA [soil metagenome]